MRVCLRLRFLASPGFFYSPSFVRLRLRDRRRRGAGRANATVPVSSWNPTRLFLIRFRSRDLRVGSWALLGVGAIYPARSRRELEFFLSLVNLVLFLTDRVFLVLPDPDRTLVGKCG